MSLNKREFIIWKEGGGERERERERGRRGREREGRGGRSAGRHT
jgi:hypothetical protein